MHYKSPKNEEFDIKTILMNYSQEDIRTIAADFFDNGTKSGLYYNEKTKVFVNEVHKFLHFFSSPAEKSISVAKGSSILPNIVTAKQKHPRKNKKGQLPDQPDNSLSGINLQCFDQSLSHSKSNMQQFIQPNNCQNSAQQALIPTSEFQNFTQQTTNQRTSFSSTQFQSFFHSTFDISKLRILNTNEDTARQRGISCEKLYEYKKIS